MDYFCKINGLNMEPIEKNKWKVVDKPHCAPLEKDKYSRNNLKKRILLK